MHVPMILRFPGVLAAGQERNAFASVLDLVPTFLDAAGVKAPGTEYQGRSIHPMRGRSLLSYLKNSDARPYADEEAVAFEIFGQGVVFMGPWKAVRLRPPWQDRQWRLYNLLADPGESEDLADSQPGILDEMVKAYELYARENGVIDEPTEVTAYPYKPGHLGDLIPES